MVDAPIRLAIISGSARTGRLAPTVTAWIAELVAQHGDFAADVIDLADAELPDSLDPAAPQTVALRPLLAEADAFVIVVPEYNRSFPGILKTAIDSFNKEWQAKPVGFVSYGLGGSGGLRAVEQLRSVFAELHATCVRDTVALPRVRGLLDESGKLLANVDRDGAAKLMLDQILWWSQALRSHKVAHPYVR